MRAARLLGHLLSVPPLPEDVAQEREAVLPTIDGTLDYQACDDSVCYLPVSVPFQWTLKVAGR